MQKIWVWFLDQEDRLEKEMAILLKLERNPEISVTTRVETWVSCPNSWWSPIPMQWFKRNPKVPLATWKKALLPWGNTRGSQRCPSNFERDPSFLPQLEKHHDIPPSMRDEAWFPWSDSRATPHSAPQLKRRFDFPEATREVPWGCRHNSSGTASFLQQLDKNHKILLSKQDEAFFPCSTSSAILSSLLKLKMRFYSLYAS